MRGKSRRHLAPEGDLPSTLRDRGGARAPAGGGGGGSFDFDGLIHLDPLVPTAAESTTCSAERMSDPDGDDVELARGQFGSGRISMRLIAELRSFYPLAWDLVVNGGSQRIAGVAATAGGEGIDR